MRPRRAPPRREHRCRWRAQAPAAFCLLALLATGGISSAQGAAPPQLLTSLPNCKAPGGVLPAGLTPSAESSQDAAEDAGSCSIVLPQLGLGEEQLFQFGVAANAQMSLMLVARAAGGTLLMDLFFPTPEGTAPDTSRPADVRAVQASASPASAESWLFVSHQTLAANPGLFTLRLRGDTGSPTVEVTVATPGPSVQLDGEERSALAGVAKACCGFENSRTPFCSTIAGVSLKPAHPWAADLCHMPPNLCDSKGRLLSLNLRDKGLRCPSFPRQLGKLASLERLDLGGNEFSANVRDAAAALSGLGALRELRLANSRLGGALDCALVTPKRKVFDLSSNFIKGPIPECLLSSPVEELYLGRNEIAGPLPMASYDKSILVALYAGNMRKPKGGLTGPVPSALLSLSSLLFVDLAGNSLTGRLAQIPPNALLFNASSNQLTGEIPALPESLWTVDLTANNLTGPFPLLDALPRLETLMLGSNSLEGAIPPLPSALMVLDASYNRLAGALPSLPPGLVVLDLNSNIGLTGDVTSLDLSRFRELRLGNNSFSGGVPPTATTAKQLTMLSLRSNKLTGPLPSEWDAPHLQWLLLSDNQLTGTVSPSLAQQPQLGTLRLEGNRLGGTLEAFASALPPAKSAMFYFDVSRNSLSGPVPDGLQRLGVFAPDQKFVMATPAGQMPLQRLLNVSFNALEGPWPGWLLSAVPQAHLGCTCSVNARVAGPDMRLACPRSPANVTDFYWQLASQSAYTCWTGRREVPLTDYLSSPNNVVDPADVEGPAFGDSGPAPAPLTPGGSAGVAVAALVAVLAVAAVAYFVGYRRLWLERRAKAFQRFDADGGAAAAARASAPGLPGLDPAGAAQHPVSSSASDEEGQLGFPHPK